MKARKEQGYTIVECHLLVCAGVFHVVGCLQAFVASAHCACPPQWDPSHQDGRSSLPLRYHGVEYFVAETQLPAQDRTTTDLDKFGSISYHVRSTVVQNFWYYLHILCRYCTSYICASTQPLASFTGSHHVWMLFCTASDGKLGGTWERGYTAIWGSTLM